MTHCLCKQLMIYYKAFWATRGNHSGAKTRTVLVAVKI